MKLLGAKLDRLARAMVLRLAQRCFQEHLPEQFQVVDILGIALQERDGRQLGLLRVQVLRLGNSTVNALR